MNVPGSPSSMLIAISRGAGSADDQLPLAAGGEAGAAQAAQARVLHHRDHVIARLLARDARGRQRVAALRPVRGVVDVARRDVATCVASRAWWPSALTSATTLSAVRMRHRVLADDRHRRRLAAADARRVQHAHVRAEQRRQALEQMVRAGQLAGDRIADAHGDRRRRGVAFLHHVEVVIEGRHLVDLGHRHLHLGRERDEMGGRQVAVAVLNLVQVLDQQVAAARRVAEQGLHVFECLRVDTAAFRRAADLPAAFLLG